MHNQDLRSVSAPLQTGRRARVAVINTHPIQHFAPLWREIARTDQVQLKVFFCSDWGVRDYDDPGFGTVFKWDVDLLGGYDSEFLEIGRRPKKLGFWETDNPEIGRALEEYSPDILVIFGYSQLTNWRALVWAKRRGCRILLFADSELKHRRALWTRLAKEVVVRGFLSQVDGVLPIGNYNANYYQHYGVPADKMHWCAYPVDGARLLSSAGDLHAARALIRARYNIGPTDFVFASVGKYILRKRHTDVIQGWQLLSDELQQRSRIILVGEGPMRGNLEELTATSRGRVILTGFANQGEIPFYYAACDALVVASEVDAHPLVVTEALFFGKPVIASDAIGCIGSHDTVRHGENALVYPCGDLVRLAECMMQLMTGQQLCEKFSLRSREIAESQDVKATAAKFNAAFRKVLTSERLEGAA
jgi:glycosyltransferase involved in cell wall biosynthesis